MTTNQRTTRRRKRSIVTLQKNFDDVHDAVNELANALDNGEADAELVADTVRGLAAATVSIEDAAMTAGVIDDTENRWRAINELRASMYHAADAIRLEEDEGSRIAPMPGRTRNAAISDATAAAEYLELARDS